MRFLNGSSWREISKTLAIPRSTVQGIVKNAHNNATKEIADKGDLRNPTLLELIAPSNLNPLPRTSPLCILSTAEIDTIIAMVKRDWYTRYMITKVLIIELENNGFNTHDISETTFWRAIHS